MSKLNIRHSKFVKEYLVDLNGKQAAIRAGYAKNSAEVTASQLLRNPKVQEALQKAIQKQEERTEITSDWILKSLKEVAERCMQAVPVMEKIDGEWVPTGEYKFDSSGANRSLELLGKHLALFTDKLEVIDRTIEIQAILPDDMKDDE